MKPTVILGYFWKLPVCVLGSFLGLFLSGISLQALGFPTPVMPGGINVNTFATWFLLGSMILAFGLSFLSYSLRCNWLARWVILEELIWVFSLVGMVLSSSLFTKAGLVHALGNGLYTMLNFLIPSLFLTSVVAILFQPKLPIQARLRALFTIDKIRERLMNQ